MSILLSDNGLTVEYGAESWKLSAGRATIVRHHGVRWQMVNGATERLSVRVTADMLKRLDALRPRIARDRSVASLGKVTRSTVLKLAVMQGLDALEREYK